MSFMSNSTMKSPIKVGILEISAQNKAILEYFFSDAGKSYFKEVSFDKASAYIIDYDSLGAKKSWETTYEKTKKPGIIISIKEVDLPSSIWLQKPLTVKALKEAGESIREMMLSEKPAEPVDATVASEEEIVEDVVEDIIDIPSASTSEITSEENIQNDVVNDVVEDTIELDDLLAEDIIDMPSESISETAPEEDTQNAVIEDTFELDDLLTEDIIDIPSESINEITSKEDTLNGAIEDTFELDDLLTEDIIDIPSESISEITPEENIQNGVIEDIEEPELALAETSPSASSSSFATSNNFVDVDLSLDDDIDDADESIDDNEVSVEQTSSALKTLEDKQEITTENNIAETEVDSLLESLISGGKNNKIIDNLDDDISESEIKYLPELTITNINKVEDDGSSINLQDDSLKIPEVGLSDELLTTLGSLETTAILDDVEIDKILHSEEKTEEKEITAEEELQSLLEEIRQEADGTAPVARSNSSENGSTKQASKYTSTNAQERWKLLCGNHKDTVDLKKLRSFDPSNHIIGSLIENIKVSKQSKEILRVKFKGIIVVIDPNTDRIYCDHSIATEFYANHCYEPITKDKIKVHQLDASEMRLYLKKMKEDSERTHCTEAFIWTTSLLTSRGRLPKNTNLKNKIGLNAWPNLTRVETIPNMMQIAALFQKNTWSLSDLTNKSGIPKKHVIAFYNAALALDMIETDGVASSAPLDLKTGGNKNRSLFSKFLKKITA